MDSSEEEAAGEENDGLEAVDALDEDGMTPSSPCARAMLALVDAMLLLCLDKR